MTSILKVWVIDPLKPSEPPKYDPTARLVNIADFETMKKSARENLIRAGYKIRSLSHTQNGEMVAYVYPKDAKVMHAQPIKGWVFKRSKVK
jgi:hypothetical protein